ncbi:hypothetical protein KEM52_003625, partial [Ascosphaera acerosa]
MRVAGLAPVELPGIENVNVTEFVNGHMAYRAAMPRIMRHLGWDVESDEFAEIEEPDPDNHAERQRELIREIDEARRAKAAGSAAAGSSGKNRFIGMFKRGPKKKEWEKYVVERKGSGESASPNAADDAAGGSGGGSGSSRNSTVLFDIDAIRAELAGEQIDVKELESTLPPIKVDLSPDGKPAAQQDKKADAKKSEDSGRSESGAQSSATVAGHGDVSSPLSFDYDYDEDTDADPRYGTATSLPSSHPPAAAATATATAAATAPLAAMPNAWQSESDFDPARHADEQVEMTFSSSFDDRPAALQAPAAGRASARPDAAIDASFASGSDDGDLGTRPGTGGA